MVEKSENSRKKRPDEGRKMENWKVLEKGGLSGAGGNQVTLRCLILVLYVGHGVTIGALPQAPAGNMFPAPFLRFAAV